jgi:hypothetical protein
VQHIDAKVFREMRGFTVCLGHLCACGHVWYQEGARIGIGNSNQMSSLIAGRIMWTTVTEIVQKILRHVRRVIWSQTLCATCDSTADLIRGPMG